MNKSIVLFLVSLWSLVACAEEGKEYEYKVNRVTGIIEVDGSLDEKDWKTAPVITRFERVLGAGEIKEQSLRGSSNSMPIYRHRI